MLPSVSKKRKICSEAEPSDKIDPVEKLLSLTCTNNDLLVQLNETESRKNELAAAEAEAAAPDPSPHPISYNLSKIMNDNLRRHYSRLRRSQMEIHNDNSSFLILTRPNPADHVPKRHVPRAHPPHIPFFKNVNFNSSPTLAYKVEDYIHYDDDDATDEPLTTDTEPLNTDTEPLTTDTEEELCSPTDPVLHWKQPGSGEMSAKMSFHYRQNDNFSFSLTGEKKDAPNDAFRFLNKRSVISGKASEMIATPNFLVSDFYF